MENQDNVKKRNRGWNCFGCNSKGGAFGWGIFLLIFGLYFLAQDLGYISSSVSFWPIFLIGFGIYFISRNSRR